MPKATGTLRLGRLLRAISRHAALAGLFPQSIMCDTKFGLLDLKRS